MCRHGSSDWGRYVNMPTETVRRGRRGDGPTCVKSHGQRYRSFAEVWLTAQHEAHVCCCRTVIQPRRLWM